MKKLLYIQLLLALLGAVTVNAKWAPMAKSSLVKTADVIVIADYKGHKVIDGKDHGYNQLGAFTVVKVLKGDISKGFSVYGRFTTGSTSLKPISLGCTSQLQAIKTLEGQGRFVTWFFPA